MDKTAEIKDLTKDQPETPKEPIVSAVENLNMKALMRSFSGEHPEHFIEHCRTFITTSKMNSVEIWIDQADTPSWRTMGIGRITASRIHQASRCKTKNGSLVDSIMGKQSGSSFAMQRGTDLEKEVFEILKKELPMHNLKQCGLFVDSDLPHFAASPDGISDDFVVEIKCPATPKTYLKYTDVNTLNRIYYAQIQLQMHITKKKKAVLGVADHYFERTKKVTQVWIDYDESYVKKLIDDSNKFWIEVIYPILKKERDSVH